MTVQHTVYTPLPVNDIDDDRRFKKLSDAGEVVASRKSAPHHRPWLVHLGIFSLYTITFLGLSFHSLGLNSKWLNDVCFLEQSIYCVFQCLRAFSKADPAMKRLHTRQWSIPWFGLMAPWTLFHRIKDIDHQLLTRPGIESLQMVLVSCFFLCLVSLTHLSSVADQTF
jgi:hypothetical protein